jgi:cysteine-rich repeat protein
MRARTWFLSSITLALFAATGSGCASNGDGTAELASHEEEGGSGGSADATTTASTGAGGSGPSTPITTAPRASTSATTGSGNLDSNGHSLPGAFTGGKPVSGELAIDDACPGAPVGVAVGSPITVSSSTTGKGADYNQYCVGAGSAADVVYAVTPADDGVLALTLAPSDDFDAALFVRSTCDDSNALLICRNASSSVETVRMPVLGGETYFVFVDARGEAEGDFSLTFDLAAPTCGDGYVNPATEECDNGANVPGSGCLPGCTFEAPADLSDSCPGELTPILAGSSLDIGSAAPSSAHTDGYTNTFDNYECGWGPQGSAPDRVFRVVPDADGTLDVELRNIGDGGGFDGSLAVWEGSCDAPDELVPNFLGCEDQAYGEIPWTTDPSQREKLTFPVTAGVAYFVVVDGWSADSYGQFWLHIDHTL